MKLKPHLLVPVLFGKSYMKKVLNLDPDNLILYHPMSEASGGVAIDFSPEGNDGAYTGVSLGQPGIGDGKTCPYFDGVSDYNNIQSAGLAADFDPDELTIAMWIRHSDFTEAGADRIFQLAADGDNLVRIYKGGAGECVWQYWVNPTEKKVEKAAITDTGWIHLALTFSATEDEFKGFWNGDQVQATRSTLPTWVGALATAVVGATNITPTNVWDGWIAHFAIWKAAQSDAKVASLSNF